MKMNQNKMKIGELKTARGHMTPPPLHVCNVLASPADAACRMYCEICGVIPYVAAPVDVDSNFLSYLTCPGYNFAQNVISSYVGGSGYFSQISSKSVEFSYEAKEMPMFSRDRYRDNGTRTE